MHLDLETISERRAIRTAIETGEVEQAIEHADKLSPQLLQDDAEATTELALQALEAIAIDDPTTDADNDHSLAICATGAVPRLVALEEPRLVRGRPRGALRRSGAA